MKIRVLVLMVLLGFAASAVGQDEEAAKAEAESAAIAEAKALEEEAMKAKQDKPDGYLKAIAEKRRRIIGYVDAFVKDILKKAKYALEDNDFNKAFDLNAQSMTLIGSKSEILGDELYKKHKEVITKQYDMIAKAQKDYLETENKRRDVTARYVALFVKEKVGKIEKELADKDFGTAFVLNSEIMLMIHKEREVLGRFYDKHKAVFLSQHDKIVRAKQKYKSETEMARKRAVQQYLQSAMDLVKNYQYEEALVMIRKVLAIDPDNDEANWHEIILTDAIRWRKEIEVKKQIQEQKKKTSERKFGPSNPRDDEITYPTPNGIIFAKKYTSPEHKEEAIRLACDAYMDSICDHTVKSRFEQALKLVKIVLKYQPDNDKAHILQTYLIDIIRWRKENNSFADTAINMQLDNLVDLSALTPETTFEDAVDMIRKSAKPELKISVSWSDLEKVSIKPYDAIGITGHGFNKVPLRTGLKRVLQVTGNKRTELDYSVDKGLVTVATKKTIQKEIEKLFDKADAKDK